MRLLRESSSETSVGKYDEITLTFIYLMRLYEKISNPLPPIFAGNDVPLRLGDPPLPPRALLWLRFALPPAHEGELP